MDLSLLHSDVVAFIDVLLLLLMFSWASKRTYMRFNDNTTDEFHEFLRFVRNKITASSDFFVVACMST